MNNNLIFPFYIYGHIIIEPFRGKIGNKENTSKNEIHTRIQYPIIVNALD